MVQRPRQSHQYIREGEGKRVSFDNLYFRVGDRAKSSWKVGYDSGNESGNVQDDERLKIKSNQSLFLNWLYRKDRGR